MSSSKRKALPSGKQQFKQTKLSFGSRSPPFTEQPRKKSKISEATEDDDTPPSLQATSPSPAGLAQKHISSAKPTAAEVKMLEGITPKVEVSQAVTPEVKPSQGLTSSPTSTPIATPLTKSSDSKTTARKIVIKEKVGDLFEASPNAVLIHACNSVGSWGGGIALAFRKYYPSAFKIYNAHCKKSLPQNLVGTALLIAPNVRAKKQHYIGCLFTSKRMGNEKDSPGQILEATGLAMRDLLKKITAEVARGKTIGDISMCHINAGLFNVPWARSKQAIEELELNEDEKVSGNGPLEIIAYSPRKD